MHITKMISAATLSLLAMSHLADADVSISQKYEADADKMLANNDFQGALVQLKNAKRENPDSAAIRMKLADVELRLNDTDAAVIDLKAARQNGGEENKIAPLLGRAYIAQGKFDNLLQDLPVRDDDPAHDRATILVLRANALIALNRPQEARSALDEAQRLEPASADAKLAIVHLNLLSGQLDNANKHVDELLSASPSAEAQYLKSQILLGKGDAPNALTYLDAAVKSDPKNISALLGRAQVLIGQNQDAKAAEDVKAALAVAPRAVGARYFQALLLFRAKDYDNADSILTKSADSFRVFPQGYFLEAVVKSTLKQYQQAEAAINAYLAAAPNDIKAQKIQADIMMNLGNFVGAANVLEKLSALGPGDAETLAMLGQAYRPIDNNKSVEAYQESIALAPNSQAALRGLASDHIAMGLRAAAEAELKKALDIAPDDAAAADSLILVFLQDNKFQDAGALIADQIKRRPNDPGPADAAGLLNLAQGHLAEAKAAFIAIKAKTPGFLPARLQLADIYAREGNLDQEIAEYKAILVQDPVSVDALRKLSGILLRQGQTAEVTDMWRKAARIQPDNLEMALGLIKADVANKDIEAALFVVHDMLLRTPNEPRLYNMLATLQTSDSKPKDAIVSLRRLIELQPENPVALRDLALLQLGDGDQPAALATITAARKLDPTSVTLAADAVRVVGSANIDDGIAVAKKAAQLLPDDPAAQAIEGDYLLFLDRPADAKSAFQRAFQAKPSLLLASRLAQSAVREGAPANGETILTDWVAAHPDDVAARFSLASLLQSDKNFAAAVVQYEDIVKRQPANPLALNNLAMIYQHDGDRRALETAQHALSAAPANPDIMDTLGWIMAQSNTPGAVDILKGAHNLAPGNLDTSYHLAVALDRAGKQTDAAVLLTATLAGGADFENKDNSKNLLSQLSKN